MGLSVLGGMRDRTLLIAMFSGPALNSAKGKSPHDGIPGRSWEGAAMYVGMYVCMYVRIYACMYACMHVCMYACMHVCMYACMGACMYACMSPS